MGVCAEKQLDPLTCFNRTTAIVTGRHEVTALTALCLSRCTCVAR